jgi:hypothetical protein
MTRILSLLLTLCFLLSGTVRGAVAGFGSYSLAAIRGGSSSFDRATQAARQFHGRERRFSVERAFAEPTRNDA